MGPLLTNLSLHSAGIKKELHYLTFVDFYVIGNLPFEILKLKIEYLARIPF